MGKIAFVFAGQGAQVVGMGKDLYETSDRVKSLFQLAETRKKGVTTLCFNGPKEQLDITVQTQPCLFLTDLACAEALEEKGITADGAAGFSLGEIPAACYAGVMKTAQAFDFVCHRAGLMQACAERNKGRMFAVLKLSADEVQNLCLELEQAYPVNYNCPGQTVVACAEHTVGALEKTVAARGGRAVALAVSGAFHSPFMDEAGAGLARYLKEECLSKPRIPLYANVTAQCYGDPAELLAKQVNHPVLWQKTVEQMISDGFDTFIEVGPGKTLSGLIRKINENARIYNVCDRVSLAATVEGIVYA